MQNLELWGGVEPTIVRLGDTYKSQLEKSGHLTRLEDIDIISDLGIKAIRYPVLQEMISPENPDKCDFSWTDPRLNRFRERGVRVIATLLHHGSGSRYTNLLDNEFPEKVASYARCVAEQYPWLDAYTVCNEILTTARFSCLYGLWFPHSRNDRDFIKATFNQAKATVLAMREIRKVNPKAELIATEDMGKIYCSPNLYHQARFENDRRWLSLDLLTGRVDEKHPFWGYLKENGFSDEEILWFRDNPCIPSILGINYYLTSERVLDCQIHDYDDHYKWGHDGYADIEAVRVCEIAGHYGILKEVCDRYKLPTALTEVHLNSDVDNQLRWLKEAWDAGNRLIKEGYDFRAITVWSLLGAFEWNSLLTRNDNFYEAGAFDISSGFPEPTPIAEMVKSLAVNGKYEHHAFRDEGWWKKPDRLFIKQEREFERF